MPVLFFQTSASHLASKIKDLTRSLLNGRPMTFKRSVFIDPGSGFEVNEYEDSLGRRWHASSSWGLIRVPVS